LPKSFDAVSAKGGDLRINIETGTSARKAVTTAFERYAFAHRALPETILPDSRRVR